MANSNIVVEITDASEFHCFRLVLNPEFEGCQNCDGRGYLIEKSRIHEEADQEWPCSICHGGGKLQRPGTGIEIMLHARSLVDLIHKCNEALCDWQKQTTDYLLARTGIAPVTVDEIIALGKAENPEGYK